MGTDFKIVSCKRRCFAYGAIPDINGPGLTFKSRSVRPGPLIDLGLIDAVLVRVVLTFDLHIAH